MQTLGCARENRRRKLPVQQTQAAVLDLFDNATAAAAFTATVLATLADAPELREQVARDGVL